MANLKDTIVLGNLTVTGTINSAFIASDFFVNRLSFQHNGVRRLQLWADGEGANIRMTTPGNANNCYEFDTCDNVLRLYYSTDDGGGTNYKGLTLMDANGVTNFEQRPTYGGTTTLALSTDPAPYPSGFNSRRTSWTWGTLTTSNGYTLLTNWATSNGSEIAFAEKSGAVSVQIDGVYYQSEGANRVVDCTGGAIHHIRQCTASEYNSLTKDSNTLYLVM